jgi:hypothetical protein
MGAKFVVFIIKTEQKETVNLFALSCFICICSEKEKSKL